MWLLSLLLKPLFLIAFFMLIVYPIRNFIMRRVKNPRWRSILNRPVGWGR